MEKIYSPINWKDYPDESTPIDAENLNKMDSAIDELDNRVIEIEGEFAEIATEVSKGKADVILANASGTLIHVEDSSESNSVEFKLIGASGSVEVKSIGKNLIDSNTSQSFIRSTGTYKDGTATLTKTESGRSYFFKDYENLEMGKTYTISAKCNTTDSKGGLVYAMLYVRHEDGSTAYETLHSVYGSNIEYTFTISKEVEKIRINFALGNDSADIGTAITFTEMQLEVGSAKTEYEPYKESTTTINADESTEAEVELFYPVTNILNDANCGMEVTYKADAKNYIDRIIGERISAIETALINNI